MQFLKYVALIALLAAPWGARAQTITPGTPAYDALTMPGPKVSGRFYAPFLGTNPSNQSLGAANTLYAIPMWIGNPSLAKTLSFDIGTGIAGAWNARLCIYADSGAGVPGGLLPNGDTGTIAISSGSVVGVQTGNLNSSSGIVIQGWVWVAFMADTSGQSVYSANANTGYFGYQLLGTGGNNNIFIGNNVTGVKASQSFGACPATFPAVTYNTANPTPLVEIGF